MILAGDVGATKTNLGLFARGDGHPALVRSRTFHSADYDGLTAMVKEFLPERRALQGACFGVAGPVTSGTTLITNLEWSLDAAILAAELDLSRVSLINDLVATGYGIASLGEGDFLVLNPGAKVDGANAAIIAAGTGLGECTLYWDGKCHVPVASEAGHADFAPHDDVTSKLHNYLRARYGIANVERALSGPGLVNLYRFLSESGISTGNPAVAERMLTGDAAAVIAQAAALGECDLCAQAIEIFVSIYGSEAGNLALRSVALGGVYLAGGIAHKIQGALSSGRFMEAFVRKDRFAHVLARIPVLVVLNENAPLYGAVSYELQNSAQLSQ